MAKEGLFAWTCAVAALGAALAWAGPEDESPAVAATLAVQTAMQQGRDHLHKGDAKAAVFALESQLARINGNPAYLALLRDAYRAYLKELRLTNQDALIQVYQQRLQILDPGAVLEASAVRGASAPASAPPPAAAPKPPATPAKPEPTIRATREDDESFQKERAKTARTLVAQAEDEFRQRRYREAAALFEKASQADAASTKASGERWAYCKLHRVVEQLNQPASGGPAWADLEKEVRHAMELAPRLDYCKTLLGEIARRRAGSGNEPAVAVKHSERGADGWARAETVNFRVFHNQAKEFAEQVARVAERTRVSMYQKWFGQADPDWSPKCDIYVHATGQDYSKATKQPANSPGHSTLESKAGRVVGRRIDLRADEPNLLVSVLPHEATHTVLAGKFGDQPVPRWADEGMAVLTEPRERIERHLRNLPRCQQDGKLFHVRQLMQLNDYPEPQAINAFYAQSVSLVEFLTSEQGPQVFSQFLRDGLKVGYEQALQKHYSFRGFDDLQQRWQQKAFAGSAASSGVAQNRP